MTTTYLGKPCKHGHDGTRYVANRHCVACDRAAHRAEKEYNRLYKQMRRRNPEFQRKEVEAVQRWRLRHPGWAKATKVVFANRDRAIKCAIERAAVRNNTLTALREEGNLI